MPKAKFISVVVSPAYGRCQCTVRWTVTPEMQGAQYRVYKAMDGASFDLMTALPITETAWVDMDFVVSNRVQLPAYRLLAVLPDGTEVESPITIPFAYGSRIDYGVAQNIIRTKYLQATIDGIPMLHYPSTRGGELSPNIDPDTGVREDASCPDESDAGGYYASMYQRPYLTWVRLIKNGSVKMQASDEGVGYKDSLETLAELLVWPPTRSGDLFIDISNDNRYIVGDDVRADMVKGVYPISYSAMLNLQHRNMPAYNVELPDNLDEMLRVFRRASTEYRI
ncbi:MAG: hypothetical protein RR382_00950 [Tannerellaceae bacterium]